MVLCLWPHCYSTKLALDHLFPVLGLCTVTESFKLYSSLMAWNSIYVPWRWWILFCPQQFNLPNFIDLYYIGIHLLLLMQCVYHNCINYDWKWLLLLGTVFFDPNIPWFKCICYYDMMLLVLSAQPFNQLLPVNAFCILSVMFGTKLTYLCFPFRSIMLI